MTTRADVIRVARSWDQVPFVHNHYHRAPGCDCIGLIRGVAIELGLFDARNENPALRDFIGYGRKPDPVRMREALDRFMVTLAPYESPADRIFAVAVPGDVIWMKSKKHPRHLGILLPGDELVHAHEPNLKVVIHRIDRAWRNRAVAAYAFPGLAA